MGSLDRFPHGSRNRMPTLLHYWNLNARTGNLPAHRESVQSNRLHRSCGCRRVEMGSRSRAAPSKGHSRVRRLVLASGQGGERPPQNTSAREGRMDSHPNTRNHRETPAPRATRDHDGMHLHRTCRSSGAADYSTYQRNSPALNARDSNPHHTIYRSQARRMMPASLKLDSSR